MIKISKRLEAISSLIPVNSNVIDVGCDHALLDIYLYQNKISSKIIASDINKNALNNAIENIKKCHLEKYIETRLGEGLDTLTNEDNIDTIIISGMGTNTIIDILKSNQKKLANIKNIIIQSNTQVPILRKELTKLNYKIDNEIIIIDNKKTYIIIKFIKGYQKYTKKELYFGPILIKNNSKLFQEYTKKELTKLKLFLKMIPNNRSLERYKMKKEIRLYYNLFDK